MEQEYKCEKCDKERLKENEIAPWRTIDVKTGSDTIVVYCEPCYDAMFKKIYGDFFN
jgi:hypothetical protein